MLTFRNTVQVSSGVVFVSGDDFIADGSYSPAEISVHSNYLRVG